MVELKIDHVLIIIAIVSLFYMQDMHYGYPPYFHVTFDSTQEYKIPKDISSVKISKTSIAQRNKLN